ncbi:hypothetical protein EW145_g5691 [Phellinidium pouzarii]|uniref:TauD/TfdA-like domain-containing protein n=1 Tax=Phellinidium pouzarii TaxID=167371 RepID=A0A4S4L3W4_9AGAM|nr:hypothetical protein EW145_g5691 [Phellinidium pouzarii]
MESTSNETTTATVKIGSLTCRPLNPRFGAEIEGIDFSKPVTEQQIKDIIAAENRFGVTVYRNTCMTEELHIAFSRQLGELEKVYQFNGREVVHPEIYRAGNTDEDGNIIPASSRHWWFTKGNALWHADSAYNHHRSKYSLLLAHIVPKEGGNTNYADTLYLASHASEIIGMEREEGLKLIRELIDHCTQPKYTISVKWQQTGDMIFWDNRQVMHRATPFMDQMDVRDVRRTTVYDDGPEGYGIEVP